MINIKAFTIWESIIAILLFSFCAVSINTFLLDMVYWALHLKSTVDDFSLKRNVSSCLMVYDNAEICAQIFREK